MLLFGFFFFFWHFLDWQFRLRHLFRLNISLKTFFRLNIRTVNQGGYFIYVLTNYHEKNFFKILYKFWSFASEFIQNLKEICLFGLCYLYIKGSISSNFSNHEESVYSVKVKNCVVLLSGWVVIYYYNHDRNLYSSLSCIAENIIV